jgi:hypothetical protein
VLKRSNRSLAIRLNGPLRCTSAGLIRKLLGVPACQCAFQCSPPPPITSELKALSTFGFLLCSRPSSFISFTFPSSKALTRSSLLLYRALDSEIQRYHLDRTFVQSIMLFFLIHLFIIAMFLLLTNTCAVGIAHRAPCAESYTTCSPPGATNSIMPPVGDAISGLYFDLVSSVNPQPVIRDTIVDQAPDQNQDKPTTICCGCQDHHPQPQATHIFQAIKARNADCFRAIVLHSAG